MRTKSWKLPWRGKMVPHAVLDILRNCDISCRACYSSCPTMPPKPLPQIRQELDHLSTLRNLSSVSILGGEPSLHPELCHIIRMIRERGLHAELFTNGCNVDRQLCAAMMDAGLDIVYFHVERGQRREDLPLDHSSEDLNNLRLEKAVMAAGQGLDVGLVVTAYPGEISDVHDIVTLTLETPEINYLLITLFRDNSALQSLRGNMDEGFSGTGAPPDESTRQSTRFFSEWIFREFGFEPFGCMGSNLDPEDFRWLSYLVGTVYQSGSECYVDHVQPSMLEKFSMLLFRLLSRRYPMYLKQNASLFRQQLILNGLTGGRWRPNLELVRRSRRPGAKLTTKRILFQNPAELTKEGRLIHCRWCPDAVLKNGALVPVCVADSIS